MKFTITNEALRQLKVRAREEKKYVVLIDITPTLNGKLKYHFAFISRPNLIIHSVVNFEGLTIAFFAEKNSFFDNSIMTWVNTGETSGWKIINEKHK